MVEEKARQGEVGDCRADAGGDGGVGCAVEIGVSEIADL